MELNINKKIINIFYNETELNELPVIFLNTFNNEGKSVWKK